MAIICEKISENESSELMEIPYSRKMQLLKESWNYIYLIFIFIWYFQVLSNLFSVTVWNETIKTRPKAYYSVFKKEGGKVNVY